ncbi:unnamed protein product [Ostreobium quekettii]|uniref:U-box domain-containing protein n=1 Tax=Ostreobium quekettii TaxID=121088 RepID=A0A8S1JCX9_9CHLO|nr:unnamed protein product [Ostreobium quekettii]|eukprot:evm.model.scf_993.3 EVM.evm.TU.scf_993.3   scf_993:16028-23407(+)
MGGSDGGGEGDGGCAEGKLAEMFETGNAEIETRRCDDWFKQLDARNLTDQEQEIIDKRVALQRKMLAEYEKRERARKVHELRQVCPEISDDEAEAALRKCGGREDEAALLLTSDPTFKASLKSRVPNKEPPSSKPAGRAQSAAPTNPPRRAPKREAANLEGGVFVGRFQSRLGPIQLAKVQRTRGKRGLQDATGKQDATEEVDEQPTEDTGNLGSNEGGEAPPEEATETGEEKVDDADAGDNQQEGQSVGDVQPAVKAEVTMNEDVAAWGQKRMRTGGAQADGKGLLTVEEKRRGVDVEMESAKEETAPNWGKKRLRSRMDGRQGSPTAVNGTLEEKMASHDSDCGAVWGGDSMKEEKGRAGVAGQVDSEGSQPIVAKAPKKRGKRGTPLKGTPLKGVQKRRGSSAKKSVGTPSSVKKLQKRRRSSGGAAAVGVGSPGSSKQRCTTGDNPVSGGNLGKKNVKASAKKKRKTAAEQDVRTSLFSSDEDFDVGEQSARSARRRSKKSASAAKSPTNALKSASPRSPNPSSVGKQGSQTRSGSAALSPKKNVCASPQASNGHQEKAAASPGASDKGACSGRVIGETSQQENQSPNTDDKKLANKPSAGGAGHAGRAISRTGHTCRGRVKQKGHKCAELVEVGTLRVDKHWHNSGYIFPEGFKSRLTFRSSVDLNALCVHECDIIAKGGKFFPLPTFRVTALDRPNDPLIAKSCTGCWTLVLKRINGEIDRRRKAGEDLPPPPKTAIAGPEYFGLIQPDIVQHIEALDPQHRCTAYWEGKVDRQAAAAGLSVPGVQQGPQRSRRATRGGGSSRKRRNGWSEDDDSEADADVEEEGDYKGNRWSTLCRGERYRNRCVQKGEDGLHEDEDNPIPDLIDPITLEPVRTPAISPYGHVMGMATWKAVLAEQKRCPFTKKPLSWEQCTVLTRGNIDRHRDRVVHL